MATNNSPLSVAASRGLSLALGAGNGIIGTVADGQTITIASDGVNGFGNVTPTTEFFSDFSEMTAGAELNSSTPTVGSFYGNSPNLVKDTYSHGGSQCMDTLSGGVHKIARIALPNSPNAIMVSYWTFIPSGKGMPAYEPDSFVVKSGISPSSWKIGWLSTGDSTDQPDFGGSDGGDLCIPSNNGEDRWIIGGNSTGNGFYQKDNYVQPSAILTYGEWLWTWVLLDPDNNGLIKVRHLSKSKGFFEFSEAIDNSFWGTSANQLWQFFNLSGYMRTGDALVDSEVYHDDLCIQGGPAAAVSVVIGDAPTLASCSDLHTNIKTNSVSDTEFEAFIGKNPLASYSGNYLFVLDSQGNPVQYNGSDSRLIP
ncbi:MAG: hypothetical protein R3180_00170 [Marinobacter sp.]|nr:hypothetical protein [Marinobacter sp.]